MTQKATDEKPKEEVEEEVINKNKEEKEEKKEKKEDTRSTATILKEHRGEE